MTGCPTLGEADPAQPGKHHHVRQHQHGAKGDGSRVNVLTGLFERDYDKRQKEVDRQ
jgi:hypothetical protein